MAEGHDPKARGPKPVPGDSTGVAGAQPRTQPKPDAKLCEQHKQPLALDGKCWICRRDAPPSDDDGELNFRSVVMSNLMIVAVGLSIFYMVNAKAPERDAGGPPIEDQIAVVEEQVAELRATRNAGGLDGAGLMALSRLENKLGLLQRIKDAKDRNSK